MNQSDLKTCCFNDLDMKFTSNLTNDTDENKENILKYKNAVQSIKNFLKKIISKYKSIYLIFEDENDNELNASFKIKVPKNTPIKDLVKYSEEILEKISEFVESENINFILPDLNITLTKEDHFEN